MLQKDRWTLYAVPKENYFKTYIQVLGFWVVLHPQFQRYAIPHAWQLQNESIYPDGGSICPMLDGPSTPEWMHSRSKRPRGGRTRGPVAQGSNHFSAPPSVLGEIKIRHGQKWLKRCHFRGVCLPQFAADCLYRTFTMPNFPEAKLKEEQLFQLAVQYVITGAYPSSTTKNKKRAMHKKAITLTRERHFFSVTEKKSNLWQKGKRRLEL